MNLAALDLNLLVALDRLLDTRSVSAAARDLGLSQPAMSRHLARLRQILGDPLLVRDGRAMVPTDRARALTPAVEQALHAVRAVFAPADPFDPALARGEVRLAMGDEAQAVFAGPVVDAFAARSPGLDVRFHPLDFATVREGRRGAIDLAFTPDLGALPPSAGRVDLADFVSQPVYERRFVVAARGAPPETLEAYVAARHTIVAFDGTGRGFVDDLLEARGLVRRVAVTVTGFLAALRLVATTDLVATLPEEIVRAAGAGVRWARPPVDVPPLPMLLVWHPRTARDPRHRFVRETVAAAVRSAASGGVCGTPEAPEPARGR